MLLESLPALPFWDLAYSKSEMIFRILTSNAFDLNEFILFISYSKSSGLSKIEKWYFTDEEMNRDRIVREERAKIMHDSMLGQRDAGDIRAALRYQKKYYTEGRQG